MGEKIIFASIEPTNVCNLDCVTCSRSYLLRNYPEFKPGSIDADFLRELRAILPDLREIKFHGMGEPFLARNVVELHRTVRELYPEANIISITNASIEHMELAALKYIDHVVVSIDHADKEIFGSIRRGGDLDLVKRNVRKMVGASFDGRLKVTINSCFNLDTYKDLHLMVELAREIGVEDIRFNLVQDWITLGAGDVAKIELSRADMDDLAEAVKRASRRAADLGVYMKIVGNPDFRIEECVWSRKMVYITKDGCIAPCCMRTEPPYYFGSFLSRPFPEIWNGDEMRRFREGRENGEYPGICRTCPYLRNAVVLRELKSRGVALTSDFIGHTYKEEKPEG
ncbi:MAG: radical SAM protein [Candidatus Omnitrophica bacterium]|nr:radical SAM protein [Candidatus Omnitrophota bacterium]